ncbi:thioredoxin-like domain-containing protein [Stratiformator vulcanicus]|uniref:Thiol-disulfide oxidoreductase YkuV n=1 Tax=Stratiformator vulcanicus TaxID=2527980 RepID=A0A517QXT4_9PLAN|nr:thioredoxin-like domain-containing protein [Stratiformator vulcanicus]QDT36466.1 Thiol-disulfide oxidoreductase YkuV [Stratiformator vulcanicus]
MKRQISSMTGGFRNHVVPIALAAALAVAGLLAFGYLRSNVGFAQQATDDSSVENAAGETLQNPFPNAEPAPSLEGGKAWLNTNEPLSLEKLKGKVVLLDFWTYCCINCIHVLPDLEYLEKKYAQELVVVGVHSAKFENEKETDAIRDAILRYEIEHPVINDADMKVWRKFGARSWPTLVLLDPEGNYCGYLSGEGNRKLLDNIIGKLVAYHDANGTLKRSKPDFGLEREDVEPTPLRFPGKVLADQSTDRLFIADSNHNRIVVTTLAGKLLHVIGTGERGADDGSYEKSSFFRPQGMALVGETLYVADTENHLIRSINLEDQTVATLAGTGKQAAFRAKGGPLKYTALNSPWDLLQHDGTLHIAMAGPHQMWSHELGTDYIGVFAGSGREDVIDGTHPDSALAQPSGIASDGEAMYVCDSEGSAIRRVPFDTSKKVTTPAGPHDLPRGATLFEFGDRDGLGSDARFQHPLGIAYKDGFLYVADSYNHKLRKVELLKTGKGDTTSWLGTGDQGDDLDPPQFDEPAGLSIAGETLFVADTNNHRILAIDLATRRPRLVSIEGLEPPASSKE